MRTKPGQVRLQEWLHEIGIGKKEVLLFLDN